MYTEIHAHLHVFTTFAVRSFLVSLFSFRPIPKRYLLSHCVNIFLDLVVCVEVSTTHRFHTHTKFECLGEKFSETLLKLIESSESSTLETFSFVKDSLAFKKKCFLFSFIVAEAFFIFVFDYKISNRISYICGVHREFGLPEIQLVFRFALTFSTLLFVAISLFALSMPTFTRFSMDVIRSVDLFVYIDYVQVFVFVCARGFSFSPAIFVLLFCTQIFAFLDVHKLNMYV